MATNPKNIDGRSTTKPVEIIGSVGPFVCLSLTLESGDSGTPYELSLPQMAKVQGAIIQSLDISGEDLGGPYFLITTTANDTPHITIDSGTGTSMAENVIFYIFAWGEPKA